MNSTMLLLSISYACGEQNVIKLASGVLLEHVWTWVNFLMQERTVKKKT